MRKKINSEAGLTLMEMLVATLILILLVLMLTTGMGMAMSSYRDVTAQSEVELLVSTALDALADDLRYARDASGSGESGFTRESDGSYKRIEGFTYTSGSYGYKVYFIAAANGQIMAYGKQTDDAAVYNPELRVLSTGAYGLDGAYHVTSLTIEPNPNNTFTISLTAAAKADSGITASGTITVRCLNKMNVTTP